MARSVKSVPGFWRPGEVPWPTLVVVALLGLGASNDPGMLFASKPPSPKKPSSDPAGKSGIQFSQLGDKAGVVSRKLGKEMTRTKYFLRGGLKGLTEELDEEDFYKAIVEREKKIDTTLLVKEASLKRIIKAIKKQSKEIRKDHEDDYSKQDTKNIVEFLESQELDDKFFRGTRIVVASGNGARPPSCSIYAANGSRSAVKIVDDSACASSIRKFLNYQEHWYEIYSGSESDD